MWIFIALTHTHFAQTIKFADGKFYYWVVCWFKLILIWCSFSRHIIKNGASILLGLIKWPGRQIHWLLQADRWIRQSSFGPFRIPPNIQSLKVSFPIFIEFVGGFLKFESFQMHILNHKSPGLFFWTIAL